MSSEVDKELSGFVASHTMSAPWCTIAGLSRLKLLEKTVDKEVYETIIRLHEEFMAEITDVVDKLNKAKEKKEEQYTIEELRNQLISIQLASIQGLHDCLSQIKEKLKFTDPIAFGFNKCRLDIMFFLKKYYNKYNYMRNDSN